MLSQVALLVVLAVYARTGVRFVRQSAAGRIGTGMLLGMLGLALVWLSQLPFGIAQHWWDRRYGLATEGYVSWAFSNWGELGAEFLSICVALLIVMAIAGKLPNAWWLPGALVFVAIGTAFQFALPYLVSAGTKPLRDPVLLADVRADERAQGLPNIPIRVRARQRHDRRGQCVRDRIRAEPADRHLGHAARRQVLEARGERRARARARSSLEQPPSEGPGLVRALRAAAGRS